MLPNNLLLSIALHALTNIHTTLAMQIPQQKIGFFEDMKPMENTDMTGKLVFGSGFDEEQCKQNQETISSMNEDSKVIGEHIKSLKRGKEEGVGICVLHGSVTSKGHEAHMFQQKAQREAQTTSQGAKGEQNLFVGIMRQRKAGQMDLENKQSDREERPNTLKMGYHVQHMIGDMRYCRFCELEKGQLINNWEIVSEKYEDIEKMYVSVKCLFLLANLIKKYQSIQPSFMGRVNTFKPDTIFKMAILKSEFKAKIQRGFQWGHYNLESDSSALSKFQQNTIFYCFLKEYILTFKASFETGVEILDFILEESPTVISSSQIEMQSLIGNRFKDHKQARISKTRID
ncbi:hypothetical protein PSHT_05945, partial [Puccinia striiformis]